MKIDKDDKFYEQRRLDPLLHVIGSIFLYQNAHYRRYNQF